MGGEMGQVVIAALNAMADMAGDDVERRGDEGSHGPPPVRLHSGQGGTHRVTSAELRQAAKDITMLGDGVAAPWLTPAKKPGQRPVPTPTKKRQARIAGYARCLARLSGNIGASHDEVASITGSHRPPSRAGKKGDQGRKVTGWIKIYSNHANPELAREFGWASIGLPALMTGASPSVTVTAKSFRVALGKEFTTQK
jgi:hypothetical protein